MGAKLSENDICRSKCCNEGAPCKNRIIAWISVICTAISLVMILSSLPSFYLDGSVIGIIVFLSFIVLVPSVATLVSIRMKNPKYKITVLAIFFSALNILVGLGVGGSFVAISYSYSERTICTNVGSYICPAKENTEEYFKGSIILAIAGYALFLSQLACLVIASYETKRVSESSTQQIELSSMYDLMDPIYRPKRKNQIAAVISSWLSFIGIIILTIGIQFSFDADSLLPIVMTYPIVITSIPHLFLLLSVYRIKTRHGFSITALIFAVLVLFLGIKCIAIFDFGAYALKDVEELTQAYIGFLVVIMGAVLIVVAQIIVIVTSSLEMKRAIFRPVTKA